MKSSDISAPGEQKTTEDIYAALRKNKEVEPVEKKYIRKDGEIFPALVGAGMLPQSKTEFLAFILDISETEKLKELNKTKDEFVALASHQLRTPATAVKQYLGITLAGMAGKLNDEQTRYLSVANASNDRQLNIINDLLKTAQIDTKEFQLKLSKKDLVAIVYDVIKQHRPVLDNRDQKIVLSTTRPKILVTLDEPEFVVCMDNLIQNASKY